MLQDSQIAAVVHGDCRRSGSTSARTHTRARILLLSDRSQGQKRTDQEVADAVLCSKSTVINIRRRFLSKGLSAALYDKGWPGAKPKFTGEVEAKLTMLACSDPPEGAARWTLRLLADKMVELGYVDSISHVTVWEKLKKRAQALAGEVLVHRPAFGQRCGQEGRRLGHVPTTL